MKKLTGKISYVFDVCYSYITYANFPPIDSGDGVSSYVRHPAIGTSLVPNKTKTIV